MKIRREFGIWLQRYKNKQLLRPTTKTFLVVAPVEKVKSTGRRNLTLS